MNKALIAMTQEQLAHTLFPLGKLTKPEVRAGRCPTLPMWTEFHKMVNYYFDGITLKNLTKK